MCPVNCNNDDGDENEDNELLNEEEYDEISLPYDDQIKKFCYDLKDCPYFFIDFNINITEKTIELLSYFSLKKLTMMKVS